MASDPVVALREAYEGLCAVVTTLTVCSCDEDREHCAFCRAVDAAAGARRALGDG